MPKKTALCIGINNYPGTSNDLNGCVNDVEDWSKELKSRGYAVTTLIDSKATKANIIKSIKKIITDARPNDSVVIQYSGHGSFVPDENGDEENGADECICPHDIVKNGRANFITDDELYDLYALIDKEARLLLIFDSCHSGTVAKAGLILMQETNAPKQRFLAPSEFLAPRELAKFGTTRIKKTATSSKPFVGLLLAGCQDHQVSFDAFFNNRANGAFSFVALQTLKKLGKNKTFEDWFKLIRKQLPSQDFSQIPNLDGSKTFKKWKVFE